MHVSVEKYLTLLFKPLHDNITNNNRFCLFLTVKLFLYVLKRRMAFKTYFNRSLPNYS